MRSSFALAAVAALATVGSISAASMDCAGLAKFAIPGVTIQVAQALPAGSFTPPGGAPIANLPAFCRVAGVIRPTADSNIQFEVWMRVRDGTGSFRASATAGLPGQSASARWRRRCGTGMPQRPPIRGTLAALRTQPGRWDTRRRSWILATAQFTRLPGRQKRSLAPSMETDRGDRISIPVRTADGRP
jgi:hypothetical protein